MSQSEQCEDGHLCVCEKPRKRPRLQRWLESFDEESIPDQLNLSLPAPKPQESVRDQLNLSLPTPKPPDLGDLEDDDEDDDDDDDDLPPGLTPIKFSKTIQERDIVWVKWRTWPHIPALVKRLYKKKKKVTVVPFVPWDEPVHSYTLHMGKNIISYFDPRRAEIMESSKDLSPEDLKYFKACVNRVEEFLIKKGLKQLDNDLDFFRDIIYTKDGDDKERNDMCNNERLTRAMSRRVEVDNKLTEINDRLSAQNSDTSESDNSFSDHESQSKPSSPTEADSNPEYCGLSKKGILRKKRLAERTKDLTQFLISDACKEYLFKIYNGKLKSENHHIFMTGDKKQKQSIQFQGWGPIDDEEQGWGPIDDEEQVETIVLTYHRWLSEVGMYPSVANSYIFDVWVPEGVVYGLKKLRGYSYKKAWQMFRKGIRSTKEELKLIHEQMTKRSRTPAKQTENNIPLVKPSFNIKLKLLSSSDFLS